MQKTFIEIDTNLCKTQTQGDYNVHQSLTTKTVWSANLACWCLLDKAALFCGNFIVHISTMIQIHQESTRWLTCAFKLKQQFLQKFIDFQKVHQACQKLNTLKSNYEQVRKGVNLPFDQNRPNTPLRIYSVWLTQLKVQEENTSTWTDKCDG